MSFKDALDKSAEAQKKLAGDKKVIKKPNVKKNSEQIEKKQEVPEVKPENIKQDEGQLVNLLTEEELRDISNRKTYQTYPTIHKMVGLACNKTGLDLITYVNEAILEQLKKDGIIDLYEIVHGKLK